MKIRILLRKYFPNLYSQLRNKYLETKVLPKEFIQHVRRLRSSDIAIDLGANIGAISEYLARSGCRVYAFEPNSAAFSELERIAEKYDNIDARKQVAGIANTTQKLFLHENSVGAADHLTQSSSLLANKPNVSQKNFELVDSINFSDFVFSLYQNIELMKIDIEGYELELINNLIDTGAIHKINFIYLETHEQQFTELLQPTIKLKERLRNEGLENRVFYEWH